MAHLYFIQGGDTMERYVIYYETPDGEKQLDCIDSTDSENDVCTKFIKDNPGCIILDVKFLQESLTSQ